MRRASRIGSSLLLAFLLTGGTMLLSQRPAYGQAAPPTYVAPVSVGVAGATYVGANLSGMDNNHYYTFAYTIQPGSTLSVTASSLGDPECCNASYNGIQAWLEVQMLSSSGGNSTERTYVSGTADTTVSSMGPLTSSLDAASSDTSIVTTITFNADCGSLRGCPSPWDITNCYNPCPLTIEIDTTVGQGLPQQGPQVTLMADSPVAQAPGSVELSGTVSPPTASLFLSAQKDGQPSFTDSVTATSDGTFTYKVNFPDISFAGSWTFTVTATSNGQASATASVDVSAGEQNHLPIILIPGVGGTWLKYGSLPLWPLTTPSSNMFHMRLNPDGATSWGSTTNDVTVGSILDFGGPVNYYGSMESYLETNYHYQLNRDLFLFAYDWRLDNSVHLPELDSLVNQALQYNPSSGKVILLAHSMGGLIALSYIQSDPSRAAKVASIITMGTPFWGSPKVMYAMANGYDFDNAAATLWMMKLMIQSFPGAYELLPKLPFVYDGPNAISLDQTYSITYRGVDSQTGAPLPKVDWQLAQQMMSMRSTFNGYIGDQGNPNSLPDGVRLYVIEGAGVPTLDSYHLVRPSNQGNYNLTLDGQPIVLFPGFGDGDGTVPKWSGDIGIATDTYYVMDSAGSSASHGQLPSNPSVQSLVGQLINGTVPDQNLWADKTAQTTSGNDDYVKFALHSHSLMTVTDQKTGAVAGYMPPQGTASGDSYVETGNCAFIDEEGAQYAYCLGSDPMIVSLLGTSTGDFNLTGTVVTNGQQTVFDYPGVPIAAGNTAVLSLDPLTLSSTALPFLTLSSGSLSNTVQGTLISFGQAPPTTLNSGLGSAGGGGSDYMLGIVAIAVIVALVLVVVFMRRGKAGSGSKKGMTLTSPSLVPFAQPTPAMVQVLPPQSRFCTKCGARVETYAKFCVSCGNHL